LNNQPPDFACMRSFFLVLFASIVKREIYGTISFLRQN
jgi:hypothetical protein